MPVSSSGPNIMKFILSAVAALSVSGLAVSGIAAEAQQMSPSVQRGQAFVRTNCSRCHAIDKVSPSPLRAAPPFRTLHLRYPVETLEEAFAEGIVTGHPSMPEFRLEVDQIADVLAFLKTLE
jgi:mono/diheme cytochrome c family protein